MSIQPIGGDGVLASHGSLILLCGAGDEHAVDAVLAAFGSVAPSGDANALADQVEQAVQHTSGGLPYVVLGPVGDALLVAVRGHAFASVKTQYGEQNLAMHGPTDGVRFVLPGTLERVRAGLGEPSAAGEPQRWTSIENGVVRAGGLVFTPSGGGAAGGAAAAPTSAPVAAAAPAPAAPPPAPAQAPAAPAPAPVYTPPPAPPAPEPVPAAQSFSFDKPAAPAAAAPLPIVTSHEQAAPPPAPPAPAPVAEGVRPVTSEVPIVPATPAAPAAPPSGPTPEMPSVAPPEPVVDRSQKFEAVSLLPGPSSPPTELRAPLPVVAPPESPAPNVAAPEVQVDDSRPQVLGVYCKNGHFDDPAARYCAVCGISMAQLTLQPRKGPRPPLGVLVLDDGSVFSLDIDYIIGRDPSQDPDVQSGSARALRFDDQEGVLSRRHARVVLNDWTVQIVDLGSANGTGVWGPGDNGWHQIPPRTPITLRPGTQIGFGRRNLRYESHRNT